MRIIAGSSGGIPIKVPDLLTRPTTDRVREAIFSMLGGDLEGLKVLDLFAGSGALGLEALSRGAISAIFVEDHRGAGKVIEANLTKAKLSGGKLLGTEVFATLPRLAQTGETFDVIFADPPYAKRPGDKDLGLQLLATPELPQLLRPGGLIVLECMATKRDSEPIPHWSIVRDRTYGSTRILILSSPTVLDGETPSAATA
jgi:16S rRNA (guanine966-N2)-methyltransferase